MVQMHHLTSPNGGSEPAACMIYVEKYQVALMDAFVADKCKWNKEKIQKEATRTG